MEAAGAVIGNIDIDVRNIFDESDPREDSGLFRLANRLHLRTKRSAVRAQAALCRRRQVQCAQAGRNRNVPCGCCAYVYDAHIVPCALCRWQSRHQGDYQGRLDLEPRHFLRPRGGSNSSSFNIQDTNFLGWGKTVQVSHGSTVDRTSDTVAWTDPNVLGSHWTSSAAYVNSSDGTTRSLQIAEPFYALDTRWSAKITGLGFDRTVSRYNLGNIVDQFNDDQTSYELSGGLSSGLVDGWSKRLLFGNPLRPEHIPADAAHGDAGEGSAPRSNVVVSIRGFRHPAGRLQESRRSE